MAEAHEGPEGEEAHKGPEAHVEWVVEEAHVGPVGEEAHKGVEAVVGILRAFCNDSQRGRTARRTNHCQSRSLLHRILRGQKRRSPHRHKSRGGEVFVS